MTLGKFPYLPRHAAGTLADGSHESRLLHDWRDEPAYVLLGDPGAGKTRCLAVEAAAAGETVIQAAEIVAKLQDPFVDVGRTAFIDALDQTRGGTGPDALAAIARWLKSSKQPRFRLACREADWRAQSDEQTLARHATSSGHVQVLHLQALTGAEIRQLLQALPDEVPKPDEFLQEAEKAGVLPLLGNPLLLELMVEAVAAHGGQWPHTRTQVYELACQRMAQEHEPEHRRSVALQPGHVQGLLEDAGLLCAIQLLSGQPSIHLGQTPPSEASLSLDALPKELPWYQPADALRSKLFSTEAGLASPRHRTVAEFLGAQALARLVRQGLPLPRVLALMHGADGQPVESMRGLWAWLAVQLEAPARRTLLTLDPLGFILNGDAAALNHTERLHLLQALATQADENPWFRSGQWVDHPFGPLATPDMAVVLAEELANPDRSRARQAYVDCLLDALKHAATPMPTVAPALAAWVMDTQAEMGLRITAYTAWKIHAPESEQGPRIKAWLAQLKADWQTPEGSEGKSSPLDPEDQLLGAILLDAYPKLVPVTEILCYFRQIKAERIVGEVHYFWDIYCVRNTPIHDLPVLANVWLRKFPKGLPDEWQHTHTSLPNDLLCTLLENFGEAVGGSEL